MLRFRQITLTQFKNYTHRLFDFNDRIIGIHGKNGVGKTNLLDAIHYLCFTKSYFTRTDFHNAQHGKNGFRIQGSFVLHDKNEEVVCIVRDTGRKEFSVNDDIYERFSRHIGRYPCVIIVPDDALLITGSSEERRKFLDALISQIDSRYLEQLITYNKLLQQRNSLLRLFAETGAQDWSLLDVLDAQLIPPGDEIYKKRTEFLLSFLPMAKHEYEDISRQPEALNMYYESELEKASLAELLQLNRKRDCIAQRTLSGIHRDDLEIQLDNRLFRNIASQGQRKSLLYALKLAELNIIKKEKGITPLLLLDDVFEKLDEDRIGNLLQKVCVENDGQVFITDTNEKRLTEHLTALNQSFQMIAL